MLCRNAVTQDLPYMVGLLRQLTEIEENFDFDEDAHRKGLELLLASDSCVCVAVAENSEGMVVGMASGQIVISTAQGGASVWIEDVVVDKPFRGKGVGRMLLKYLEKWAVSVGAGRMQLLADSSNDPAIRFYINNEWVKTAFVAMRKLL